MTMPIISQMIKRSHVSPGRPAIISKEISAPMIGTNGTRGVLKGRGSSGSVRRSIHTPAQTITNASNVQMINCTGNNRSENRHKDAHKNRRNVRGAALGVNRAEPLRQQAVFGHGKEDA